MNLKEWPVIVRQHSPLVWQTAYRLLANHADASDCFQETFVGAWEMACRQPVRNWPGFLQHLATARALDQLRGRRRAAKHLAGPTELGGITSIQSGPLAQAQSHELAAQLRRALAELPEQQSQAFCLRHLNGFSYEQIADALGITVSNVGVSLHRATERLRVILAPVLASESDKR
jgi:RNA polymerase sigma-70 factor, ECF subfamily